MLEQYHDRWKIVALFCLSFVLFITGLSAQEIVSFDARFYLFVIEMRQYGVSFFPTVYHHLYPDYLGTSTAVIYFFSKLFGGLNKFVAVFPTAVMASMTVVVTYLIGALHRKCLGLYAVFFLFLTLAFLKAARSMALDMYPTFFTAACFYLIYSADLQKKYHRIQWIYLFFILSFAFRGPMGLVIPAGVVCSYYLVDKQFKPLLMTGSLSLFLLILSSAILFELADHVGGRDFVQAVLRMQVLGRMGSHAQPMYFYFIDSFVSDAISFPIASFVFLGVCYSFIIKKERTVEIQFLFKLIAWALIILIGMSIPGDKKVRYVLPMAPALALLSAYVFVSDEKNNYFSYLRAVLRYIFLFFPTVFLLMMSVVFFYVRKNTLPIPIHYFPVMIFFLFMQGISFFIFPQRTLVTRETGILFLSVISFFVFNRFVIEPIELSIDAAHAFVFNIETKRLHEHAKLIFYDDNPDGWPIKYVINMPKAESPLFMKAQRDIIHFSGKAFLMMREKSFDKNALSFPIIARGRLGHVDVVVLEKRGQGVKA